LVDPEVFDRRLAKLEQVVKDLRGIAGVEPSEYRANRALQAQAERWIQVAVEVCLDLAHHLIADRGWATPTSYRQAFDLLARHTVIEAELATKLAG
jgi:uncharacterized protein YutE (UPF0331/DUF86 family)